MKLKVEIRYNPTQEIVTEIWENFPYNQYWWEEGNASCDCNREIFFLRAKKLNYVDDTKCSEGKYSVRLSDADTGELLYTDFNQESSQT